MIFKDLIKKLIDMIFILGAIISLILYFINDDIKYLLICIINYLVSIHREILSLRKELEEDVC